MPGIHLNPSISVIQTGAGALLRSDLATFQLQGQDAQIFTEAILPLLDGSRGREAIVDALRGYPRHRVLALLDRLEQRRVVEVFDAPEETRWRGHIEFFRSWTGQPQEPMDRLRGARVLIVGLEPWGAAAAIELAASGIGTLRLLDDGRVGQNDLLSVRLWNEGHVGRPRAESLAAVLAESSPWCRVVPGSLTLIRSRELILEDENWDLAIGTAERDGLRLFQSLAAFAHKHHVPSLYGCIEGLEGVIGPAVVPGRTACWNCVRLRRLANADRPEIAHALQRTLLAGDPPARLHTYVAPMAALVGHLLALEAVKLLSRYAPSQLVGRILVQNLVTLETTVHMAIRMPWCEICGGSSAGESAPSGPDVAVQCGGGPVGQLHDLSDAGEVRKVMAGWVDSRTGVIKHLTLVPPEPAGPELPITCAAVLSSYTEGAYISRTLETASGKGLAPAEAMVGAIAEAIERYSAARYRLADLRRAAFEEMDEDRLDPRLLCLYDDAQYDKPRFPFARFDPTRRIAWTRGWWLDTGQPVWVPALLAYHRFSARAEEVFCQVTSNGLAAGADLSSAVTSAVLELVERDAFMLTWLTQRPGRRLSIDGSLDPEDHEIVRQLRECGAVVELFLLDAGLGIPVVACVGLGDGRRWPGVTVGLGADLNPRTAVRKAIFELGQTGPYICRLMTTGKHRIPSTPDEVRGIMDHALYYTPASRARAIEFLRNGGAEPLALSELVEPLEKSLRAAVFPLNAAGVRIAVVDVTAPDVAHSPFRVVRALATGLQPIDFGFTLRRSTNPRLKRMLACGLNPHPHPLA